MTTKLAIEMAAAADAAALATVHQQSFPEPWDENVFGYLLTLPSSLAMVERCGNGIAGFVLCRFVADESEVLTFAVSPTLRRRGIGFRLMAAALEEIRGRGGRRIFLEVAEDAPAALALYERFDFYPVGRRRRYYTRGVVDAVDAVVMRCDL